MCCKDEERDKEWRKVENERLRANISGLLDEIRSLLEEEKEGEILEREREREREVLSTLFVVEIKDKRDE